MDKKRIYVSDIHMGAGRSLNQEHVYDWLGPREAKAFAAFLKHLKEDDQVGEIVLLGDAFDSWVCPVDEDPPTFEEIVSASHNQEIVENLRRLASEPARKVILMPGNHDMAITREFVESEFPGIVFGGSAANKSVYRTSRLLAEHGSSHAMFNAPDPIHDPRNRLPLGYYISRVVATKVAKTGDRKRQYWTYVDDFLELLGPQKLPESVFEALLEEAGLSEETEIRMRNAAGPYTVRAGEIKRRYADLYDQWVAHEGPGMAFKALMAEIGYLGDLADHLSKTGDTKVIIFGHSHESELDKDSWFVEDRIYANCGTWCEEKEPRTFVETQKDDGTRRQHVRLMAWKDGKVRKRKEEWIDL